MSKPCVPEEQSMFFPLFFYEILYRRSSHCKKSLVATKNTVIKVIIPENYYRACKEKSNTTAYTGKNYTNTSELLRKQFTFSETGKKKKACSTQTYVHIFFLRIGDCQRPRQQCCSILQRWPHGAALVMC